MEDIRPALTGPPPDDTGADTFARFRYQAKVAFPFFLRCGLGGDEVAIIPEHYEDLTLEYAGPRWRFAQIKSRNAAQGMWTLSDLLGDDGALVSLFRTFQATKEVDGTYELHLELSVSPKSAVAKLKTAEGRSDPDLIRPIAKGLRTSPTNARRFLSRVRLMDPLPSREHIDSVNVWLLMAQAPALTYEHAKGIYARSMARLEAAMAAEPLAVPWPAYVSEVGATATHNKRLTHHACKEALGNLGGVPSRLLSRILDATLPRPTVLETKLLAAGAPPAIVEDAIQLRANAVFVEYETQGIVESEQRAEALSSDNPALNDVQQRVLARMKAVVAAHSGSENAGPKVWSELMTLYHQHAAALDPRGVFRQDGMLLLGEACELSDQCLSGWGATDA